MSKIAVDIYGADSGYRPVLKGAVRAMKDHPDLELCFVGDESDITPTLISLDADMDRVTVINAPETVTNDDHPTCVLKGKDDSSLVRALLELKNDDECIGMISPGNTGALLVGSIFRLGLIDGLKAPALASNIPCNDGEFVILLDCGANMDCRPPQFEEFAVMGNELAKSLNGIASPRIGLLSVGREEGKGTATVLEAYKLLKELPINFIGNAEGTDVSVGYADVVVADGFSGNVLLKDIEAVGKKAISVLDEFIEVTSSDQAEILKLLKERYMTAYDFNSRGGATFLGTVKPVVKMHGMMNSRTAYSCIEQLLRLKASGYSENLKAAVSDLMERRKNRQ